jgi:hypothetical protein
MNSMERVPPEQNSQADSSSASYQTSLTTGDTFLDDQRGRQSIYFAQSDARTEYDATQAGHFAPADLRNLPLHQSLDSRQPISTVYDNSNQPHFDQTPVRQPAQTTEKSEYRGSTLAELLDESNRTSRDIVARQGQFDTKLQRENLYDAGSAEVKSDQSSGSFSGGSLTATIQRISVALCLVLGVTCVLLLLGKYLFFGRSSTKEKYSSRPSANRTDTPSTIKLLTQLRLDNKSQLYLVQAAEQQVLVAVDMAGIKSVVPLQADFRASLEAELAQSQPQPGTRSIVQAMEEEMEDASEVGIYSAATFQSSLANARRSNPNRNPPERVAKSNTRTDDLESEMKRKLAELLRGTLVNKKI